MQSRRGRQGALGWAVLVAACLSGAAARACPFCLQGPSITWGEQLDLAKAAVIVEKLADDAPRKAAGNPRFKIIEVLRAPDGDLAAGDVLIDEADRPPVKEPARELWCGRRVDGRMVWTAYVPMTSQRQKYLAQAPPRNAPATRRLPYYVQHLAAADADLSTDAYWEIAAADYADVKAVAETFPRDKLRAWLLEEKPRHPERRGLYALMLGLCGTAEDARLLKTLALQPAEGFSLGLDGVMGGWLLLEGAEGLAEIEQAVLVNPDASDAATFAAVKALRFMWTYGEGRIPPERLRAAMRKLIDRPGFCETAVRDLARWKDWSVQARLMELYDAPDYKVPSTRRAIIGYMIASTRDTGSGPQSPPHAVSGARYLQLLREKDPKRVADVEAYLPVLP